MTTCVRRMRRWDSHRMCPRHKSSVRMLLFLAAVSLLALSIAAKGVMTWAAYWNYPVRSSEAHALLCAHAVTRDCV